MQTAAAQEPLEPIIIYRSVNRNGQTFGLDPLSHRRLRGQLGDSVHLYPRVFIAHETLDNYDQFHADLAEHVVVLLTGMSESKLAEFGGVSFRDPVTDEELPRH